MPRPPSQLIALAKIGAEHRYRELHDELRELVQQFPHLRTATARAQRSAPAAKSNANGAAPVRRRRRISAAARKRISEARKARWAAQRKGAAHKKNGVTGGKSTDATSVDLIASPTRKTTRFDCPPFDG